MVEWPDELAFGVAREPDRWVPSLDQFVDRWNDGQPAMAVMTATTRAALAARGLAMHTIARDNSREVVVNTPAARRGGLEAAGG